MREGKPRPARAGDETDDPRASTGGGEDGVPLDAEGEEEVTSELPTLVTVQPLDSEVPDGGGGGTVTAATVWPEPGDGADASGDRKYAFVEEIGRGGMGAIYRVEDRHLHRQLAMKVLLHQKANESASDPGSEPDLLQRFLEEAQVTAQLDHPGVVAVHDLGTETDGRAYFTMNLVRGETLAKIFKLAREERDGWDHPRAIAVLQRVCETVAFAHSKGVIHRDLKPANVMVGKFGEVYVMDWGLAKVRGRAEPEAHAAGPAHGETQTIRTIRSPEGGEDPDAPETLAGRALGTPAYMAPEQAAGRLDEVDEQSDVYALGAMLYQLLAGHPPYMPPGYKGTPWKVVADVVDHAPAPLVERAPRAPPELVSIIEKAMERDRKERYASAAAVGEDLQRFLSGHVVRAHKTGPIVEFRKWVARNKAVAGIFSVAVIVITALTGVFLRSLQQERDDATHQRDRAVAAEDLATTRLEETERERAAKARALDDVLRLADTKRLADLRAEADTLWPVDPGQAPRMSAWVERAEVLVENLTAHRATLTQLEADALPYADQDREQDRAAADARIFDLTHRLETATGSAARQRLEVLLAAEHAGAETRRTWRFPSEQLAWQHGVLEELVSGVEALTEPERGLLPQVRTRQERAASLAERTLEAQATAWEETVAAIADRRANPEYGGLRIEPQLGLLPLGKDPRSGLFEFALADSGEIPERDASTHDLIYAERTAIVFVLIPGGDTWIGAQGADPDGPNYDPEAQEREGPVHRVTLSAYFLAKHECTQAQWWALTGGEMPSSYQPGRKVADRAVTWRNPVENVTWDEGALWLARYGLTLPSEAQWEHACRAASPLRWSGVDEPRGLAANVADEYLRTHGGPPEWPYTVEIDDAHGIHAPVGSYAANAYGLHDVHGNVWEWCADWFAVYGAEQATDPVVEEPGPQRTRVKRGGAWNETAFLARAANRYHLESGARAHSIGLRPARMVRKR